MSERVRTRVVHIALSADEYAELRALQQALGLGYRAILLIGMRHSRQRLMQEQARQARAQRRQE